jgi:serine phosphatase RsbU (regulator of sigma subunit)
MQCLEIWGGTRAADEAVSVHGMDVYVFSEPHRGEAAGGDIYLASMCNAGNVARFVLADVAGHGEAVSELAESLRGLMRKHVATVDQTQLTRALNAEFASVSTAGRFATAVLATYFAPTDHLIVVNAGHPPPLWYRVEAGAWNLLEPDAPGSIRDSGAAGIGVTNLPLGIIEPTDYRQFAVHLARGDLVVLYTDSLIEATNPDGDQLGLGGLLELVRSVDVANLGEISGSIRQALRRFRGGAPSDDDLTLLVLHHNAADPQPMPADEQERMLGKMMGNGQPDPRDG